MIKPELKTFDCSDHDPIDEWRPAHEAVSYSLTLHIGAPNSVAADLYNVWVFTPAGLQEAKALGIQMGPEPPIVLRDYSWDRVLAAVERRLAGCEGSSWVDVQDKLKRYFRWEYDGFK